MKVEKLADVTMSRAMQADSVSFMPGAVMGEQRDNHRNHQEVHGVRKYVEVAHHHRQEQPCNDGCELWSPE